MVVTFCLSGYIHIRPRQSHMLPPLSVVTPLTSIIPRFPGCQSPRGTTRKPQALNLDSHHPPCQYTPSYRLTLGKYRLLNAFPNVLIRLPTVAAPSCILLASASSSADCVTDASNVSTGQPASQPHAKTPYTSPGGKGFPSKPPPPFSKKKKKKNWKGERWGLTIKIAETAPHTRRPVAPLAALPLPLAGQFGRPSGGERSDPAAPAAAASHRPRPAAAAATAALLSSYRRGAGRRVARLALPQLWRASSVVRDARTRALA